MPSPSRTRARTSIFAKLPTPLHQTNPTNTLSMRYTGVGMGVGLHPTYTMQAVEKNGVGINRENKMIIRNDRELLHPFGVWAVCHLLRGFHPRLYSCAPSGLGLHVTFYGGSTPACILAPLRGFLPFMGEGKRPIGGRQTPYRRKANAL